MEILQKERKQIEMGLRPGVQLESLLLLSPINYPFLQQWRGVPRPAEDRGGARPGTFQGPRGTPVVVLGAVILVSGGLCHWWL